MKTLSVQQMPNGFEVEQPSFGYWLKAGMAFTLGGGIVTVTAIVLYAVLWLGVLAGIGSALTPTAHQPLRHTQSQPR
jgi:hypothetical protein